MRWGFYAHWGRFPRRHLLTDLLDRLFDVAGIMQNPTESIRDFGAMSDVTFHHVDSIIQNLVDGHCHHTVNGIATLLSRVGYLSDEQLQGVERECDVSREDLQELQAAMGECGRVGTFDIDGSQQLVM